MVKESVQKNYTFVSNKKIMVKNPHESLSKPDSKYDLIKFFLSLLVLAIHSTLYPMILYPWLRIAVPLFFTISSYFVFLKMKDASAEKQKAILKKFVTRNLKLYLCWFVILLPITIYVRKETYFSGSFFDGAVAILQDVLFGSTFVASWFITATVTGVLIIYALSRLIRKNWIIFLISLFTFCIVTIASSYQSVIEGTLLSDAINTYIDIFGGLVCSFPAAIFWVFIGKLFAEKNLQFKSSVLLLCLIICSCIALFSEWRFVISLDGSYNNDSYFMLAPLCVLLFFGIQKIKPTYWEHSLRFKRASTIIYVSHGSLVPIFSKLIYIAFGIRIHLLTFILTFLCCISIYVFIEIAIQKCRLPRINKVLKSLY